MELKHQSNYWPNGLAMNDVGKKSRRTGSSRFNGGKRERQGTGVEVEGKPL